MMEFVEGCLVYLYCSMEEKSTCGSDVLVECRVEELFFLHGEKIGEAQRTNEDIR